MSVAVEDLHALVAAQPGGVVVGPGEPEALTGADLGVDAAIGFDGQPGTESGRLGWAPRNEPEYTGRGSGFMLGSRHPQPFAGPNP